MSSPLSANRCPRRSGAASLTRTSRRRYADCREGNTGQACSASGKMCHLQPTGGMNNQNYVLSVNSKSAGERSDYAIGEVIV